MLLSWQKINSVQRAVYDFCEVAVHSGREILSHARAVRQYPLGYLPMQEKGNTHPAHAVNPRPILLIHGVAHNKSAFRALTAQMKDWQFQNVFTLNYNTRHGSLTAMVEDLAQRVDEILALTKAPAVDIVAHSLGGLVARYYMTFGSGRGRVRQLLTLGTAHQGTEASVFLRLALGGSLYRDLRRKSYFIHMVNQTAIPQNARIVSIFSKHDRVIWPIHASRVEGHPPNRYLNYEVDVSGHLSLLYSPKVFGIVQSALSDATFKN